MEKKTFFNFINLSIARGKKEDIFYKNGLDLTNFMDEYSTINNILLKSNYGEETSELINDFIFDSVNDELEKNKDMYIIYKDDKILADCSTLETLYNYVEEVRLELIKEKYSYEMKKPISEENRLNILKEMFKFL